MNKAKHKTLSPRFWTMASSHSNNWEQLERLHHKYWSRPLVIDCDEFLVVPQKYSVCNGDGVYKYKNEQWDKIIDYDSNFGSMCHSASIDNDKKMLYVYDHLSQLHASSKNTFCK